jgi:hypothetical protein
MFITTQQEQYEHPLLIGIPHRLAFFRHTLFQIVSREMSVEDEITQKRWCVHGIL